MMRYNLVNIKNCFSNIIYALGKIGRMNTRLFKIYHLYCKLPVYTGKWKGSAETVIAYTLCK